MFCAQPKQLLLLLGSLLTEASSFIPVPTALARLLRERITQKVLAAAHEAEEAVEALFYSALQVFEKCTHSKVHPSCLVILVTLFDCCE